MKKPDNNSLKDILLPPFIREFLETESAGGIVMIACAILAMLAANSGFAPTYNLLAAESIKHFVNDVLMVLFFLVIGLELKSEMCEGVLAKRDQILLPLLAAMGGMAVPALIFCLFNYSFPETLHGWAIPCATDIAFAVAILTLLGKNIPPSIKIFLLAIAIFDDLGAIIIIAAFYNTGFAIIPMIMAAVLITILAVLNKKNIGAVTPYLICGVFLWLCFHYSGIHTTLAGVILGLSIPMQSLHRVMHILHPWVSFLILPVFAFVNAGVGLQGVDFAGFISPLPLGITLGLFLGKQFGIFGTSFLLIKSRLVSMPEASKWAHIYAVSVLAGIGFTMSLFIGILAFPTNLALQELVKIGVIAGSLLCIVWGAIVLKVIRQV